MVAHAEDLRSEVPNRTSWVAEVARDWRTAALTARESALCEFAAKLTREPPSVVAADHEPLRAAGLDDRAILDLTHVIGFFAYANRVADGLGCELEDYRREHEG